MRRARARRGQEGVVGCRRVVALIALGVGNIVFLRKRRLYGDSRSCVRFQASPRRGAVHRLRRAYPRRLQRQERLCPAAAAEGRGGAAVAAANDSLFRAHRQHRAVQFGGSGRARPGLSAKRSTTPTAARSRKATLLFGIERDMYQAQLDQAKATLANARGAADLQSAEYERQAALGEEGLRRPRRRSSSGGRTSTSPPPRSSAPRPRSSSPHDQSRLHQGRPRRSTASSPIISSTSALWSASADRRSSPPSSRPTRSTCIST